MKEGREDSGQIPFKVEERRLETPFYLAELNGYGQITRLYDKEAGREVLAVGERGNVLQVFEDKLLITMPGISIFSISRKCGRSRTLPLSRSRKWAPCG